LNDLVEDALKHNPNVQAAQAGLRVARETTEAQKGAYAPTITPGYNSFTQKASTIVSPPSSNPFTPYLTLDTAQVDVSYTPDVFGLVRREVETDEALAAVQQFQVEGNLPDAHLQCGGGGHPRGLAAGSNRRNEKDHSHRNRPPAPAAHSEENWVKSRRQMWHCKRRRSRKRKRPCRRSRSNWRNNAIC
jgi:hypothetical protein